MKKILVVLLTLAVFGCGKDNSTDVGIQIDANGCFIAASDFNERSQYVSEGLTTVNYVWDCGDYVSLVDGRSYKDRRVSLTFTNTVCLQFQGELVTEGRCLHGPVPTL
jgi:hypothetical protein